MIFLHILLKMCIFPLKFYFLLLQMLLYEFCKRVIFDISYDLLLGLHCNPDVHNAERENFYTTFKKYLKHSYLVVERVPMFFFPETKRSLQQMIKMLSGIEWKNRLNVSKLVDEINNSQTSVGKCSSTIVCKMSKYYLLKFKHRLHNLDAQNLADAVKEKF